MIIYQLLLDDPNIAPFTGAWIEIEEVSNDLFVLSYRTLHGCVD